MPTNSQAIRIRQFLIDSVNQHPSDLVSVTAKRFGVTRQAVHRHLQRLCREGMLQAAGQTKARTYFLGPLDEFTVTFRLEGLEEHIPWDENVRPHLASAPKNVIDILSYGFTEMFNNAIDHSESESATARLVRTAQAVTLEIEDQGVGIFRKIQRELHLPSERQSMFELFKGKLTTDPIRHTGEGVFFTSRMVDRFALQSGKLRVTHDRKKKDWQIEELDTAFIGTLVRMTVSLTTKLEVKDLFDDFADAEELTFSRSHAPIKLAQFGWDRLVSRSQARRVVARFDRFSEVVLDFSDVDFIGQAFADEIFRVFQTANPTVSLTPINTNRFVAGMIHRAKTAQDK